MSTTAVLRKKIHAMIDELPDQSLQAIKPLLDYITEDYWKPVIEPASPKEIAMIDKRIKEYEEDPSSFTDWETVKADMNNPHPRNSTKRAKGRND